MKGVGVLVKLLVGVGVAVFVGLLVAVLVGVEVQVLVKVWVGVSVAVLVGVFEHGGGEQVGGGVAVDLERLGVPGGEDLEGGVLLHGARQVEHLAVDLGRDGGICQAGTDASGNIDGACPCRGGLFSTVRQSNFNVTHREFLA